MTERLYYTDAYLRAFEGRVTATGEGGLRVYLDRSAFYPTSGGQPHDLGTLGGVVVREVVDEGERVAHLLDTPLPADAGVVQGAIDWGRRFDHMQQHTGQHLLSAVFDDALGHATVSVHFGAESATLDLDVPSLPADALREVEHRANGIVWEDREVAVSFEDAAVVQGLRKPTDRAGTIRVVSIQGMDRSACGGTHVRRTGEIGAILLRRVEKVKQGTRVEFLCGGRAIRRARGDFEALQRMSQAFSVAPDELAPLLERQRESAKEGEKERRRLELELDVFRARALYDAAAVDARGRRVVVMEGAEGGERLRGLAQAVSALPGAVLVATTVAPPALLVAAAADAGVNAGAVVKGAVTARGGRGGGSPTMGQGSVPDGGSLADVLREVLDAVRR